MHKAICVCAAALSLGTFLGCSDSDSSNDPGVFVPDSGAADTAPPPTHDAGGVSDAATPPEDSGGGHQDPPDAGPPPLIWPNDESSANSDPWIMEHHDQITEMHPRALVIHFANGHSVSDVKNRWDDMVDAMNTGSIYHGYNDPNAKPFVYHELFKLVDLTDKTVPTGWTAPNSTKMPRLNGGIDFSKLYTTDMANLLGVKDPKDSTKTLTFCEMLQKGVINELFIAFNKTGSDGNVPEIIEYKQMYDENDKAKKGQFNPYAGNGWFEPADLPEAKACGISIRVDFLEMTGNLSGAMHVLGHNFEHIGGALPVFKKFFNPVMNMDFDTKFNTPFSDWYGITPNGAAANFISYPDQNTAKWSCPDGTGCAGKSGTMSPYNQGCGNTHYAPNSRNSYDMNNAQQVLTRCEHYGMKDGPDGKDMQTLWNASTVAKYAAKYGSDGNGGGWQIYWFQSFPGYNNKATAEDGTKIKNFWPYLYY